MSHCYKIGFPPKSCSHLIEIHTNTSPYTMHNWNIYGRWSITHKLALNALECLKMLCFTTMSHCYIFSFRAHVFQIYSQNPFYIPQWLWWWCAKVFRWYCDMMYSDVFRCIQMYSVIRINNVIKLGSGIRVIANCRLPPALLDQNWFVERVIWKVLLLHNKILINQDFMYLEGAHQLNCCFVMVNPFFNWFFFRYFLILSAAPVASILASDMLSQKFTKNWQYTPQNWIMATISGPKRNNLNNQIFQQL